MRTEITYGDYHEIFDSPEGVHLVGLTVNCGGMNFSTIKGLSIDGDCGVDEKIVLECGMGGRLDSTNVIKNPYLSVITGISLDHTAFLGDTIEKIAKDTDRDFFLTAQEAIEYGLADEIITSL